MVSLCTDVNKIFFALETLNGSVYIREYIKLYLESYGTAYDFQDVYLQINTESDNFTAVILRHNSEIYISVADCADFKELVSFISGFSDCTVFTDCLIKPYFSDFDICLEMSRKGVPSNYISDDIINTDKAKLISDLICEFCSEDEKINYFLNLSHQIRHDLVNVFYHSYNSEPTSVVILSKSEKVNLLTAVYTKKHFRGNGFAKQIINRICCDSNIDYVLLCEEHNLKFYEKCGFSVADTCIKIRL